MSLNEADVQDVLWAVVRPYAEAHDLDVRYLGADFDKPKGRKTFLTPKLNPDAPRTAGLGEAIVAEHSGRFTVMVTISNDVPETVALRHAREIGTLYLPGGVPSTHAIPGGHVRCQQIAAVSDPYGVGGHWIRVTVSIPYLAY